MHTAAIVILALWSAGAGVATYFAAVFGRVVLTPMIQRTPPPHVVYFWQGVGIVAQRTRAGTDSVVSGLLNVVRVGQVHPLRFWTRLVASVVAWPLLPWTGRWLWRDLMATCPCCCCPRCVEHAERTAAEVDAIHTAGEP